MWSDERPDLAEHLKLPDAITDFQSLLTSMRQKCGAYLGYKVSEVMPGLPLVAKGELLTSCPTILERNALDEIDLTSDQIEVYEEAPLADHASVNDAIEHAISTRNSEGLRGLLCSGNEERIHYNFPQGMLPFVTLAIEKADLPLLKMLLSHTSDSMPTKPELQQFIVNQLLPLALEAYLSGQQQEQTHVLEYLLSEELSVIVGVYSRTSESNSWINQAVLNLLSSPFDQSDQVRSLVYAALEKVMALKPTVLTIALMNELSLVVVEGGKYRPYSEHARRDIRVLLDKHIISECEALSWSQVKTAIVQSLREEVKMDRSRELQALNQTLDALTGCWEALSIVPKLIIEKYGDLNQGRLIRLVQSALRDDKQNYTPLVRALLLCGMLPVNILEGNKLNYCTSDAFYFVKKADELFGGSGMAYQSMVKLLRNPQLLKTEGAKRLPNAFRKQLMKLSEFLVAPPVVLELCTGQKTLSPDKPRAEG
ncbi:hypothetical protein [Endozoicomonas arenosclerae]|uniref:hypothetical protein n=1 Tax=Endozoicomonas arenosclerae TaxID=1633495 RepID=UPI000AD5349F|nr:hypothetical protein [Endozoicomonas arenosclerae]